MNLIQVTENPKSKWFNLLIYGEKNLIITVRHKNMNWKKYTKYLKQQISSFVLKIQEDVTDINIKHVQVIFQMHDHIVH